MQAKPHTPSFLFTKSMNTSSLENKTPCIDMDFLILESISLSSIFVLFKKDPEYLITKTDHKFICRTWKKSTPVESTSIFTAAMTALSACVVHVLQA